MLSGSPKLLALARQSRALAKQMEDRSSAEALEGLARKYEQQAREDLAGTDPEEVVEGPFEAFMLLEAGAN
jgi:hypothetical protein